MKIKLRVVIMSLLWIMLVEGMNWAAVYYVEPGQKIQDIYDKTGSGDTIYIKKATYRQTIILHKSHQVIIKANPGDEGQVIINAAEPITNWQKCSGPQDCAGNPNWSNIYYADVSGLVSSHESSNYEIRQVFQNGTLLKRSRYPNALWSYPVIVQDPTKVFSDPILNKGNGYFTGSICHIKTQVWQIDQLKVVNHTGDTITLEGSPWFSISSTFGYYLTNIVGEINEEGEWAYNPNQKRLYIWPKNGSLDAIEISYRNFGIRTYSGASSHEISGLTIKNANLDGMWLYQCNDMKCEENTVEYSFRFGIFVQAAGGNNQIIKNKVKYSCFMGIYESGTSGINIEGNYVYATGAENFADDLMNGVGHGIFVTGSDTRVYNNRIDRTGYNSLFICAVASNRNISYNYITNSCLSLSDGGGIYTASYNYGSAKDYIHHNIIKDVYGCLSMDKRFDTGMPPTIETHAGAAPGIYIDEQGNNRVIEYNTLINSYMTGIFFHWAPSNVVNNNTLYGNKECQIYFSGRNALQNLLKNIDLLNNIIFSTNAQQKTFNLVMNYDDAHFGQSNNNYFYNPFNEKHIYYLHYSATRGWVTDNFNLSEWRTVSGYDADSKEFSYLYGFKDITIDAQKRSTIIHNPTLTASSINLGNNKYCDVNGNKIYGSVTLKPFESKILIYCDYAIPSHPPVLDPIGNKTVDEGVLLVFSISATDPDGDNLTYSASNLPQGATFNPTTKTFSWTPTYQQAGTYSNVHFEVTDGALSDSEDITITVNNMIGAPVLDPIGNKSVDENTLLTFTVNATDPEGGPLTYSASNLPQGATFNPNTKTFTWTPTYDQAGIYPNVHFEVSDSSSSDSEDITITVNNINRTPVLDSIGNKSIVLKETLTFTVNATDPDGDPITYSAQGLPTGAIFQNQAFTWTPIASDVGSHEVTFIASDGSLSDSEKIVIEVELNEEIKVKIKFNTDRISKIGILYISGETNEGAVIKEVKVLNEYNKILDIDMKDEVSINGEKYITGIVIVKDIIKKYPLLGGIKVRIKVAMGEKTKEGETGVAIIEPYAAGPDRIGVYNNVFNPIKGEKTIIKIDIAEQTRIKINLYDTKGKKIKELADGERDAGMPRYYWDGKDDSGKVVGSGVYFAHIEAGNYRKTEKIVVVK